MKKLLIFFILTNYTLYSGAQSIIKTMKRLPDTGESTSYTNTFGEDNDYNYNVPYFIINGDGTVTDTVTGLMWQQTDGGEMKIEDAISYCKNLNLAAYNDWRLPNAHEAFSILNHQHTNPALDNLVFTSSLAEYWWTSDRQNNDTNKIWATNAGGGIGNHPRTETISAGGPKKFHVRAVRDVQTPNNIASHFTVNQNATVTDMITYLSWQQVTYNDSLTWENALNYADTATFGGYTDWRLPNIKELQSINDESKNTPSINTNIFTNMTVGHYWSSSSLPNQATKAWYLDTKYGITSYEYKTRKLKLILVKGNGNPSIVNGFELLKPFSNSIKIYPNPCLNAIKVTVQTDTSTMEIINSMGQKIYLPITCLSANSFIIDTHSLISGLYFIKTIDNKGITSLSKFIRQ